MATPIRRIQQMVNIPGYTLPLYHVVFFGSLIPHFQVCSINDIDFQAAKKAGVKGVVFDKDNTLTRPLHEGGLEESIQATFETCKRLFPDQVYIISNSIGTLDDPKYSNAREFESQHEVRVLRRGLLGKKPGGVRYLRRHLTSHPSGYLMVGDRILTDILFGNRAGMLTVLVDKFTDENDIRGVRGTRALEQRLMKALHMSGRRPSYHPLYSQGICPNAMLYGLHKP